MRYETMTVGGALFAGGVLRDAAEGHRQAEQLEEPLADGIRPRFHRRAVVLQERDIVALQSRRRGRSTGWDRSAG